MPCPITRYVPGDLSTHRPKADRERIATFPVVLTFAPSPVADEGAIWQSPNELTGEVEIYQFKDLCLGDHAIEVIINGYKDLILVNPAVVVGVISVTQ